MGHPGRSFHPCFFLFTYGFRQRDKGTLGTASLGTGEFCVGNELVPYEPETAVQHLSEALVSLKRAPQKTATSKLSRMYIACIGVDFSEAKSEYWRKQAEGADKIQGVRFDSRLCSDVGFRFSIFS